MKSQLLFLVPLLTFAAAERRTSPNNVPQKAILLSDVQSLTLRNGKMTTSRRVSPVPQLTCTGPEEVCKLYQPEVMRCTNEGADYDAQNIQWSCRADLPEEFKLGSTDVICEGYASSDDDYVLKGSCGVEYRLLLTNKGEEVYGNKAYRAQDTVRKESEGDQGSGGAGAVLFMVVFVAVLGFILVGMINACRRNPPRLGGRGDNWGGGGDNDPPPPYDPDDYQPRSPPEYKRKTNTQRSSRTSTGGGSSRQRQDAWRPGPVTAGLAGAGLGYLVGRNAGPSTDSSRRERPVAPAPPSPPSSSSAGPSYSSSRYESTGFGGTSRR